jgi:bacillithiol biosynthesis cysteine-adding enzyme BshC
VEPYCLKNGQQLASDYRQDYAAVQELYVYNPWEAESGTARAAWLDQHKPPRADRNGLIDALLAFNRKAGNAQVALDRIAQLRDPQSLVVVGGQQAGLFTGALLVIYKAVTILHAAKAAEEQLGRPVIPVFWIAGEDHDWDEVNHVTLLNVQQELTRITLNRTGADERRTSVSRIPVRDWETVISQLDATLLDTEFKADIMGRLKQFADQSATLTDFFAQMMAWLFGQQGLVLLDSDDQALRKLEGPMFERLVTERDTLTSAYLQAKAKVEQLGYAAQAEVSEQGINLFIYNTNEERTLLYRSENGEFTDRKGNWRFCEEELLERATHHPEELSNNVLTRPLMQEYLLPVLHTVLGPGELSYWGLLKPAFAALGMQMPILLPRKSYTLIEGTVAKHMRKYELSFDDVLHRFTQAKENWLRDQDHLGLMALFNDTKEKFRQLYEPVVQSVSTVNPGMAKLANVNMMKILEQMEFLEARSTDAYRSQFDAAVRQWDRIALSLAPQGKLQERTYSVLAYLGKYGDHWLQELLATPSADWGSHQLVYLSQHN